MLIKYCTYFINMPRYPRRQVLGLVATGLAGSVAGCVGSPSNRPSTRTTTGSEGPSATASFFVFGDFAAHVAGDIAVAETLVPIGQHGHGWAPGPRVREAILDADLFVYGMPGFQPWADDVVRDLRADDHDVQVVATGHGIDLLEPGHEEDEHDGHEEDGEEDHEEDGAGDREKDQEGDHDEQEHAHASAADPHFWLDPLRAKQAVTNVQDGFVGVDAVHGDAYGANATAYRDRLDDLDESLETTLANRSRDVLLVAGHDAFQYLHDRYGFEVEALTGIAPDDQPSPRDVERAQRLIEEHDLEYICADPLESQRAAEQLAAETDARAVLPLTAMPGRTRAWQEDGWGYADVMERVNRPTLERALDAA